ncbi:GNAT family N-acetyltransferase [Nocardioides sp. LHG3406-4]|uniref:GNAT family N-acetyltransferase n=1 Tax=Nocardioides sp. LHG3406-4 TaxID=2804575 RepID=UPI003CF920FD
MATLTFYDDPRDFLARADGHLRRNPVLNTVVATYTERLAAEIEDGVYEAEVDHPRWWLVVTDAAGEVVGAAMRTAPFRPHPPFLLAMPDEAAVELARVLHERGEPMAGINGALPGARLCAEESARLSGGTPEVAIHTRLFELEELIPPRPVDGALRLATPDDAELALTWFHEFLLAADEQAGRAPGSAHDQVETIEGILRRIELERLWFWTDGSGERVHMTGANPPAYGAARVGPVYTPVEHRGHGYASAAVAEVSRRILAHDSRPCLFTDQANPTSNAIYLALGYRPVVDMVNMLIQPR